MKKVVLVLALVSFQLQALASNESNKKVISKKTAEIVVHNLGTLNFRCKPGVPFESGSFPTSSVVQLSLSTLQYELNSNNRSVFIIDPQNRSGDFCQGLKEEIAAHLPAKYTVTRTLTEQCYTMGGKHLKSVTETLKGTLGNFPVNNTATFNIGDCN